MKKFFCHEKPRLKERRGVSVFLVCNCAPCTAGEGLTMERIKYFFIWKRQNVLFFVRLMVCVRASPIEKPRSKNDDGVAIFYILFSFLTEFPVCTVLS